MDRPIPKNPIEEYTRAFRSKTTKSGYRTSIRSFLQFIYDEDPSKRLENVSVQERLKIAQEVKEEYERLARKYLSDDRNYYRDVRNWLIFLRDEKGYAPNTQSNYLSAVKGFFIEYELDIKPTRWEKIQRLKDKRRCITQDKVPTKEELKKVLATMPLRGRAMVKVLVSSGMRSGELLKVTWDSVHLEEDPGRIHLKAEWTKNSKPRDVLISQEAERDLRKWKKYGIRDKESLHIPTRRRVEESERVFPFNKDWANQMWKRGLKRAGLDERDEDSNMLKRRIHTLRKFFNSKMKASGVPEPIVEYLMGHISNLRGEYDRFSLNTIREEYKSHEDAITIHKIETRLQKEMEERNHKIQKLREELKETKEELQKLKKERRMDEKFKEIARKVFREEFEEGMKLKSLSEEEED